ncbi:MAG: amidohydrolase family protein [Ardenticatenaceae bacterium]|nr:amidohydrolase family protein [Ardenticatenaceae bacterium]
METLDFFDSNCRLGQHRRATPPSLVTARDVVAELDHLEIREAVVYHATAQEYLPSIGNADIVRAVACEPRLHASWVLPLHPDPGAPPAAQTVTEMLAHGVRVARLFPPASEGYLVAPWACGGLFEALEQHRVPVLLSGSDLSRAPGVTPHNGAPGFSVGNIYELCERYPSLPLIITRFNYSHLRVALPMLARFPNLFVEISYFTAHGGIELFCETIGASRIIFGTGMPSGGPGGALVLVRYAAITHEEKQLIASANLRRLISSVRCA